MDATEGGDPRGGPGPEEAKNPPLHGEQSENGAPAQDASAKSVVIDRNGGSENPNEGGSAPLAKAGSSTNSKKIVDDVAQAVEEIVRRVAADAGESDAEEPPPRGTKDGGSGGPERNSGRANGSSSRSRKSSRSHSSEDEDSGKRKSKENAYSSDDEENGKRKSKGKRNSSEDEESGKRKSKEKRNSSDDEESGKETRGRRGKRDSGYSDDERPRRRRRSSEYSYSSYEYEKGRRGKRRDDYYDEYGDYSGRGKSGGDYEYDDKKKEDESDEQEANDMEVAIPLVVAKYSDEELQAALDKMLKTGKMPDFEMRADVVDYARNQSIHEVMRENYDRAAKIDKAIEAMVRTLNLDETNQLKEQETAVLRQHLQSAQDERKRLRTDFDRRISDLKSQENAKLDQLREQHACERKAFELSWSQPQTLAPFNKPSSALLYVRHMQKAFAISRDFVQAKRLKQAGDQMQREETKEANRNATQAMKTAYARLLSKQEREIKCFMDNGYRKLATLESERDRSLQANDFLRTQLEAKIKEPRTVRRAVLTLPVTNTTSRGYVPRVITMQTRSQYANFKRAGARTSLNVQIKDVAKITQTMTKTPLNGKRKPIRFE